MTRPGCQGQGEGGAAQQQRLSECLERLCEAEKVLTSVRRAESLLADVRRALLSICGEEAVPRSSSGSAAFGGQAKDEALEGQPPQEPSGQVAVSTMPRPVALQGHVDQILLDTRADNMQAETGSNQGNGPTGKKPARLSTVDTEWMKANSRTDSKRGISWVQACGTQLPVFLPDCAFLLIWDFVGLVFILFETFNLPFDIAFRVHLSSFMFAVASVIDTYFIIDIGLNFLRSYWSPSGHPVVRLKRIARNYVKWIWADILAGIPWEWIGPWVLNGHGGIAQLTKILRLLRIARLLRLLRLNLLPEKTKVFIECSNILVFLRGVMRVIFLLFGITHWAACLWFIIGLKGGDNSWISKHMPPDADLTTQYVYSLYFTLTTMTTVGYGDITPTNPDEVGFVSVLLVVATVVFASLMGSLTDLIFNLQSDQHIHDERNRQLNQYMIWRCIPEGLMRAIRSHMKHQWETNQGYDEYESHLKNQLPPVLNSELCFHMYKHVLQSAPFLGWIKDYNRPLRELASVVLPIIRSKGDKIFRRGDSDDRIFILSQGSVRMGLNENIFSAEFDDDDEAEEIDEEVKQKEKRIKRSGSLFFNLLQSRGEPSDGPILEAAVRRLQRQDMREKLAAASIQKLWRQKPSCLPGHQRRRKKVLGHVKTTLVNAPAYFGESCLWEPLSSWGSPCPHTYSLHCEARCEGIFILRSSVHDLLVKYSPWLRNRFELFRQIVLNIAEARNAAHDGGGSCSISEMARGLEPPPPTGERVPSNEGAFQDGAAAWPADTFAASLGHANTFCERAPGPLSGVYEDAGMQLGALAARSRDAASRLNAAAVGKVRQRGGWSNLREPLMRRGSS